MRSEEGTCLEDDGTTHEPVKQDIDKAKLWDEMKAGLEYDITQNKYGFMSTGDERLDSQKGDLRAMLTRMEMAETMERVRNDLRVKA